jgi:ABC-type multidrug transport system ATPase subunit
MPRSKPSTAPNSEPALLLEGIRRDFGDVPGLPPVDATLPAGATLAVLGPNGSGKSTLLRILVGLLRPSDGQARVLGAEVPKENWKLRGKVGYLGHDPLLYRDLTARENLTFAARLHGLDDAPARIEELFEQTELVAVADRRVAELSAGLTQRVAACRAVLHDPDLLVLDEPEANLDSESRERIEALFDRPGRTRVIASHDRDRLNSISDQTLELG